MTKRSMLKRAQFLSLLLFLGFVLTACIDFSFIKRDTNSNYVEVTSIVIENKRNLSKIFVGDELEFTAKVYPEGARNAVNWSSSDKEVATVDIFGKVTAHKSGLVQIIATTPTGKVQQRFHLTIVNSNIIINELTITGSNQVFVDDIITLKFSSTPATPNLSVEWISSDEEVAEIDKFGRLSAKTVGTVNIQVKYNEVTSEVFYVEVLPRSGMPISFSLHGLHTIEKESTTQLKVETKPFGALNSVVYSSSDEAVASVDVYGLVTGLRAGTVTITATHTENPDLSANFIIEVVDYNVDESNFLNVYKKVVKDTKNSILGVSNYKYDSDGKLVSSSLGSGVVYKVWAKLKDGTLIDDLKYLTSFDDVETYHYFMLTNKHVVEGADEIKVYLHQEDIEVDARVVKYDSKVDIAVVEFSDDKYYRPLKFADISGLEAGEIVLAIGNPQSYEYSSSATLGIVSIPKVYMSDDTDGDGISDWDAEYILHDAAINPGNSGGPLVNTKGEIIGINTLKLSSTEIEGMGFAIPVNVIESIITYLQNGEVPIRATIGVSVFTVKEVIKNPGENAPAIPKEITYGLYVNELNEGVAKASGVLLGDIILSINGIDIYKSIHLRTELGKVIIGEGMSIPITVYRSGEVINIILQFD